MGRQLWLADKCRSWGLEVVEVGGWRERGSASFTPRGIVCHHTAGAPRGDYPSLRIVRDGRQGLPGPLSQIGLGRTGRVYVIAAGRANHAGSGSWRGLAGNSSVLGIEAESVGTRDDWTAKQRVVYPRLVAALCDGLGIEARMVCGHKEWTRRKIDPAYWDMHAMRGDVARLLAQGHKPPVTTQEDDDMVIYNVSGDLYAVAGHDAIRLTDPAVAGAMTASGIVEREWKGTDATFVAAFDLRYPRTDSGIRPS